VAGCTWSLYWIGFSRYVVSWALDDTLSLPLCSTLLAGPAYCDPQIWNTDQGSQFQQPAVVLIQLEPPVRDQDVRTITSSLSACGASLNTRVVSRDYGSPRQARQGIGQYFQFYNTERPHRRSLSPSGRSYFG